MSADASNDPQAHRSFLNRYYGISRHFYDVTRKYYLFGRDRVIRELLREPWDSLIEVGPGTGRNLRALHEGRPGARLGGVEASDAMLEHAKLRCPWATLVQGFAEQADFGAVLGRAPERILFSYCLSMVQDKEGALDNAQRHVAPAGEVVVVDFADLGGMVPLARRALRAWLNTFHVEPLDEAPLRARGATITYGPFRYFLIARLPSTSTADLN